MNRPRADWLGALPGVARGWRTLEEADAADGCGGKAVNLGRMRSAGLPVPEGVVVDAQVLRTFLAHTGLDARIDGLRAGEPGTDAAALGRIEAQVRAWFDAEPWPTVLEPLLARLDAMVAAGGPWAVRSSAAGEDAARASCAGLMDSVLGVTAGAPLERALRQVWASRWSARALAYERDSRQTLGGMAVVVQRQIEPVLAGVIFTRSPEPGRAHEMLCEYCVGLADRLVAGEIDPSRLRIARDSVKATSVEAVGAMPVPDAAAVEALAHAALSAERLFGAPQDIEFALDASGKPWLVQSRPITCPTTGRPGRRILWSNANVNENFPEPISPLLYSVVAPGYSAYFANLGRAFGLAPSRLARMEHDLAAIVGVHAGRLYYNLTAIHAVLAQAPFGDRLCAWFDTFTGAADPAGKSARRPAGFVRGMRDAAELAWIAVRTTWQYLFIERRVRRFEATVDRYAEASRPDCLAALDPVALRDLLRGFMDIRLRRWTDASLADAAAMVCYGLLESLVGRVAGEGQAAGAHNDLLKGLSGLKSAEPVEALWALAQCVRDDPALRAAFDEHEGEALLRHLREAPDCGAFLARFERYLDHWGFRCSGELMLTVPSFQERPAALLDIVRGCASQAERAPEARLARQREAREAATLALLAAARRKPLLAGLPWPSLAPVLRRVLVATQASIGLRERARLKQALLYARLRRVALEIGTRLEARGILAARDDVFFLAVHELDEWLSGRAMFPESVRALVELRRTAHARFADQAPADVLEAPEGVYPQVQGETVPAGPAEGCLRGTSVCGGVATGPARVLSDVAQTAAIAPGDILVTRQTDPGWAPAFVVIGGLVLERGGMLSHGAILAREYGIPTVVGVAGATQCIEPGSTVRVDGDRGEVQRVVPGP